MLFVEFLGWFEEPKTLYIAMEYLKEGDLTKHIGAPLPQETVQNISKQILEGLKVMHQQGIAHRDLKPAVTYGPYHQTPCLAILLNADKCIEHFCSFYVSHMGQARGFRSVKANPSSSCHNLSYPGINSNV